MIERIRTKALWAVIVLALLVVPLALLVSPWWWLLEIVFVPLVLLGIYDYFQQRHSILRNYPLAGRMRFLLEGMGPELHQYLVENDTDGRPFDRDTRSVIYAAREERRRQEAVRHRARRVRRRLQLAEPLHRPAADGRRPRGGPARHRRRRAVRPALLGVGAEHLRDELRRPGPGRGPGDEPGRKAGGFAHDTGEGGLSRYHKEAGGDLIWQIGTGYFGCRDANGDFDPEAFRDERRPCRRSR